MASIPPPPSSTAVGHEMLWRALGQLVDRVFGVLDRDGGASADAESTLDDCLDIVVELLNADRGLVLMQSPSGPIAITGRRQRTDANVEEGGDGAPREPRSRGLTPEERERISTTIVREAFESGRCVCWQPNVSEIGSMMTLGIVGALAVRIRAGAASGRPAVLYVDFRDVRKAIRPHHVDFFSYAANVIGAVLEQHARGETARAHLREARGHTTEVRRAPPLEELLGTPSMRPLLDEVRTALASNASVLVVGESGTGKTLLANAIAEASGRRPVVRAMLGGSDDLNTITSELFGHEKGSFSGATSRRIGLAEYADRGTLILDELLNLPLHAQKLLLDFTQFGTYRPLGWQRAEPKKAELRIIAATNGDMKAAIRDGRFREDLFYRLAHVVLELPPLRARRADIPLLAELTLRRLDPARTWALSRGLRELLVSPAILWSGNVRQLERVVTRARERALVRDASVSELRPEHLDPRDLDGVPIVETAAAANGPLSTPLPAAPASLAAEWQALQKERAQLDAREATVLKSALTQTGGVVAAAARELGIARTTLSSRVDVLGLRRKSEA